MFIYDSWHSAVYGYSILMCNKQHIAGISAYGILTSSSLFKIHLLALCYRFLNENTLHKFTFDICTANQA